MIFFENRETSVAVYLLAIRMDYAVICVGNIHAANKCFISALSKMVVCCVWHRYGPGVPSPHRYRHMAIQWIAYVSVSN